MKVTWNDTAVLSVVQMAENGIIEDACFLVTQKSKDSMVEGSYRRWMSKRGDGSYHWSSSPGTAPAPDTEELKDSISYSTSSGKTGGIGSASKVDNIDLPIPDSSGAVGHIGTKEEKGLWNELGTRLNEDKRPFLRPALTDSEDEILAIIGKHKI
ncbi:MAG: hypothetical protein ACYC5G_02080 [Candidatus Doudnabacteria bacterium]